MPYNPPMLFNNRIPLFEIVFFKMPIRLSSVRDMVYNGFRREGHALRSVTRSTARRRRSSESLPTSDPGTNLASFPVPQYTSPWISAGFPYLSRAVFEYAHKSNVKLSLYGCPSQLWMWLYFMLALPVTVNHRGKKYPMSFLKNHSTPMPNIVIGTAV